MSSKRITKDLASRVACRMLESVGKKKSEKELELSDFVINLYKETIDKKLWETIESIPSGWVNTTGYFYVNCEYGKNITVYLKKDVKSRHTSLTVSKENYEKVKLLKDEAEKINTQQKILKQQIEDTLFKLQTFNRIKEQYPEAYEFIPKEELVIGSPISLPISSIQETINKIIKS